MEYFIGQILPHFIGRHESVQLDMTDWGSYMTIALNEPTNDEVRAFFNTTTDIRLTCFKQSMWFTFKFGQLDWMDAPYHPRLSPGLHIPNGLSTALTGLTIMLINTLDGRILYLGQVDIPNDFAYMTKTSILAMMNLPFDKDEYDQWLKFYTKKFKPFQIAKGSIASFTANS